MTKARKLDDPRLVAIAAEHGKTAAQVLIRYILQKGIAANPKSTNPGFILPIIRQAGATYLPAGEGKTSFIDTRDIAAVAAKKPTGTYVTEL